MKQNQTSEFLTAEQIEKQETLTREMLEKMFVPKFKDECEKEENDGSLYRYSGRPKEGFVDLMCWAEETFKWELKDQEGLNRFVHNRIIIDGQFVQFARENKIVIECLFRDSVISWKTENDFEKFFVQGGFKISGKIGSQAFEFLQFSAFSRGANFDDEVSFFIIVSENNYNSYVQLRNLFDEWCSKRDRGNLHIRVIDGEDIPYTKDHKWEDLFLPADIKKEIKDSVEGFLKNKPFYEENKIPWKKGLLLFGAAGNGKTSIIRTVISQYDFKPITIAPGANSDALREAFSYAEEQSPALLYFEDLDSILGSTIDISTFLNLMDGVASRNGLFIIGTCNEIRKLPANITDRPSRFDRKIEIPRPTAEMAFNYLKKWFGKFFPDAKLKEMSKKAEKNNFSYVHLKELYISTMFQALSANRKKPTTKDLETALKILIKDKNALNGKTISTDKFFGDEVK